MNRKQAGNLINKLLSEYKKSTTSVETQEAKIAIIDELTKYEDANRIFDLMHEHGLTYSEAKDFYTTYESK